jgi:hypothetical protein
MKNTTTTAIQMLSTEKGTLVMFFDETAYASFLAGDDSKEVKAFMIDGLNFGEQDMTIILENGVPTKVNIVA